MFFGKFDCRLFISKSSVKAVCILLVSSTFSHFHKPSPTLLQGSTSLSFARIINENDQKRICTLMLI